MEKQFTVTVVVRVGCQEGTPKEALHDAIRKDMSGNTPAVQVSGHSIDVWSSVTHIKDGWDKVVEVLGGAE